MYEYDYRGFFPSIDNIQLSSVLLAAGVSPHVVVLIESLNKSQPKLAAVDRLDETYTRRVYALQMLLAGVMDPSMESRMAIKS